MFKLLLTSLFLVSLAFSQTSEENLGEPTESPSGESLVDPNAPQEPAAEQALSKGSEAVQTESPSQTEIDPDQPSSESKTDVLEQLEQLNQVKSNNFIFRSYIYDPGNRRDPFSPTRPLGGTGKPGERGDSLIDLQSIPDLERFNVSEFKVTGIIWSVKGPKALVRDPKNGVHLLFKNTKIGTRNGYVADIRESEIVVIEQALTETGKVRYTTQVLKMGR